MSRSSSTECHRYLIAIGSPYCPNLGFPNLNHVESDIKRVVDLFEKQGYERILHDLIGATSQSIKQAMTSWFSSSVRRASDCVVVYYGGHGDEGGRFGQHYLFTVESTKAQLLTTAIETRELIKSFFSVNQDTSPQNVLLILDTCYANAGGRQISNVLSELKGVAPQGSGFWVISSSDSNTEAGDGAFVKALCAVMHPDRKEFQRDGEFISIEVLIERINQHFIATGQAQRAIVSASDVQGQTQFFRNPQVAVKRGLHQEFQERSPQVSSQLSQLINCLWSLDYNPQSCVFKGVFEDYTPSRRVAAFVVQAKDSLIQRWLVKRLVDRILNVKNAKVLPFTIPAHPIWKNRNFDELWIDLARNLECDANKTAVLDMLAATYQTKPIVLAMYGWENSPRSQKLQKEVLTHFWQPLVSRVQNFPNQPSRSRLILFLTEGATKDPEFSVDPNLPIRLAPLTEITTNHVETWLESKQVDEILGEIQSENRIRILIEEEIMGWDSDPTETLQQICYVFGLENGIAEVEPEWRLVG